MGKPPSYFDCITNFIQIRNTFGSIWETWRSKREDLGPALYFYLVTRRGLPLYLEHRFVSLVWGIEVFHRKQTAASQPSPLAAKVNRILAQVSRSHDRKWLAKKLENANEPSLGERIFETLSRINLGFEVTRLRAFSDKCATLRNDISHFGGVRHDEISYNNFIEYLNHASETLALCMKYCY